MEQGYIKLYRSINQNDLLDYDNNCYIVFTKLLTRCDRMTGSYRTGRNRLAAICNMKPSTVRDALNRLEAATMIRQQADSKATTIYICNWWKYQQDDDSKPTAARQQTDTKQEERKRSKDTKVSNNKALASRKTPSSDIDDIHQYWAHTVGYEIVGNKQKNRYACSNLIKKHGTEVLKRLIDGVAISQTDKFAPRISDFTQLQAKQNDLISWGKRRTTSGFTKGVDL